MVPWIISLALLFMSLKKSFLDDFLAPSSVGQICLGLEELNFVPPTREMVIPPN